MIGARRPEWLCFAAALLLLLAGSTGWGRWAPTWLSSRREFVPGPVPEHALRIVTWNVGGPGAAVGQEGGHALLEDQLDELVARIVGLQPQLLFLQELESPFQLRELASRLGAELDRSPLPYRSQRARGRTLGIVALQGDLERAPGKRHRPPEDGSLLAEWRSPAGRRVLLANVHADPWEADPRNRLLGWLSEDLIKRQAEAVIWGGDLNLDVDPGARRDLFSDRSERDIETYGFLSQSWSDVGLGSGSTAEPQRRLDYLFIGSGQLEVLQCAPARGLRFGDMDHHPLVADLKWWSP